MLKTNVKTDKRVLIVTSLHPDTQTETRVLLPSGLFLGWMLRRVVESLAPDRPRGSVFGMDSRGRRSCRASQLGFNTSFFKSVRFVIIPLSDLFI